ncbi:MAG TPA: cytochrome c oxidase assembly protein [Candidatus Nitrosotalea sp.]|nr:cytochrome c oxidase assembly protein [Candidatus Nitrosotalea sp.]
MAGGSYLRWAGPGRARHLWFGAGLALIWLALETPIDTVGDRSLQSVHMLQHVLLGLVAPPMLLLGLDAHAARRLLARIPLLERVCSPLWAQLIAALVMVGWHLPPLYDLTARSAPVHVLEHLSFIAAGIAFWWPVLEGTGASLTPPLSEAWKAIYIFIGTVPQDGVALVLQFSRRLFYSQYANEPVHLAGWTPVIDQNVAGAVLMVIGKTSFAVALLALFFRWMARETASAPGT